jgi:hypothetical protein
MQVEGWIYIEQKKTYGVIGEFLGLFRRNCSHDLLKNELKTRVSTESEVEKRARQNDAESQIVKDEAGVAGRHENQPIAKLGGRRYHYQERGARGK